MRSLVVYDSVFGNTELIAQEIARVLPPEKETPLVRVSEFDPTLLSAVELLIVGSPTRKFRPTEAIDNFVKAMPARKLAGVKIAAFDTRFSLEDIRSSAVRFVVRIGGYAAKQIAEQLMKKGGELILPPEGFLVVGEQGPLKPGELERAGQWAREISSPAKPAVGSP